MDGCSHSSTHGRPSRESSVSKTACPFPRMRSEGFPFIVWGSGGWTRVRVVCAGSSRCTLGVRSGGSLIPCRGDWRRKCRVCGAVSLGLLTRASSGLRRVIGIGREGVVWVAPCL